MLNDSQKTIPYTQSPAELENLRLLRKTARFFNDLEKAREEPEAPGRGENGDSDNESRTNAGAVSDKG